MKINIFGVGRSGTKAVELYLSYLIAKKNGKVWINYEPYYWQDRILSSINHEGIINHVNNPLLLNNNQNGNKKHKSFLEKLIKEQDDLDVITKFIRGNGRIKYINSITKPDYTIIIIRDLYQVLNSLAVRHWDLLGTNLKQPNDWYRLIHEVKEQNIIANPDYYLKRINNKLEQNAFYWYIMNLIALDNDEQNAFYVDYDDILKLDDIAEYIGLKSSTHSISDSMFNGDNIHKNNLLINNTDKKSNFKYKNTLFLGCLKLGLCNFVFKSNTIGSENLLDYNNNIINNKSVNRPKTTVEVKKNEMLDSFNEDIMNKLKNKNFSR